MTRTRLPWPGPRTEVVQEAMNAGVWIFGGGLESQKASIVATDGTVTDGPYPEAIGGVCVVDVPSRGEALKWAAKNAGACRCAQGSRGVHARPDRGELMGRRPIRLGQLSGTTPERLS